MRKLLILCLAIGFAGQLNAVSAGKRITGTGGAPIPTAYSASDTKSLIFSSLRYARELCVFNDTSAYIAVNFTGTGAAPTSNVNDRYIPDGVGRCYDKGLGSAVYIRSDSGSTITSGDVILDIE